jgi:hypothetical protein
MVNELLTTAVALNTPSNRIILESNRGPFGNGDMPMDLALLVAGCVVSAIALLGTFSDIEAEDLS